MKVSGKTVLVTLMLSAVALLGGYFAKEVPAFGENKQGHTLSEIAAHRDVADKIDIRFTPLFECDDDYVSSNNQNKGEGIAVNHSNCKLNRVQKQILKHTPRYLLYCNLKLDFC
jgi:hypothetical protein